jgi:hypothetical protein
MAMVNSKVAGYSLYTRALRKLSKLQQVFAGHCGGSNGHCND